MNKKENFLIKFPEIKENQKEKQLDQFFEEISNLISIRYNKIFQNLKNTSSINNSISNINTNSPSIIVIDMANLNSINSFLLAKLLYYQRKFSKHNGEIKLVNMKENIKKILINLEFDKFFNIE